MNRGGGPHGTAALLMVAAVAAGGLALVSAYAPLGAHAQEGHAPLETRTIGVIAPYGSPVIDAVDRAVYDFNLGAAERGWTLEAVKADGGGAGVTLELVRQFESAGTKVLVIVSPADLSSVYDYANQNGMLVVTPTPKFACTGDCDNTGQDGAQGAPTYVPDSSVPSDPGDYIFSIAPNLPPGIDMITSLFRDDGMTRVITITTDDTMGRWVGHAIADSVGRTGGGMEMTGSISMPTRSENPDYSQVARALGEALRPIPGTDYGRTAVMLYDRTGGGIADVARSAAATLDDGDDSTADASNTRWYGPSHAIADLEGAGGATADFLRKVNYKGIGPATYENHINVCIDAGIGTGPAGSHALSYQIYNSILMLGDAIDLAVDRTGNAEADAIRGGMAAASIQLDASRSATGLGAPFGGDGGPAEGDRLVYAMDPGSGRFAATERYDSASGEFTQLPAYEKRRIGSLVSETGPLTNLGYGASKAACLAVADYNGQLRAEGADWQLYLEKLDDGTMPARSLENIKAFHADGIRAVLGPVSSGSVTEIKPFVDGNDMLAVSYSSSSPLLKYEDDRIFRIRASDDDTVFAYARLFEHDDITDVVAVYRDDVWGRALHDKMSEMLGRGTGAKLLLSEPYAVGASPAELGAAVDRVGAAVGAASGSDSRVGAIAFGFQELGHLYDHAKHHPSLQDSLWYGYSTPLLDEADHVRHEWMKKVRFLTLDPIHVPNDISRTLDTLVPTPSIYSYYAYDATFILAGAIGTVGSSTDAAALAPQIPVSAQSLRNPAVGFPIILDAAGDLGGTDYVVATFGGESFVKYAYYDISEDRLSLTRDGTRVCR